MAKEIILVIDDEVEILENCRRILEHSGYRCFTASNPESYLDIYRSAKPDLVITDLKMPGKDGLEILREVKSIDPQVFIILFTAFATWETAVSAIKDGAFDYIAKPFTTEQLLAVIDKAFREKRLLEENQKLKQELGLAFGFDKLIGVSPQLKSVLEIVRKIATTEANILIQGESGTGKELIARAIHRNSSRGQSGGRFVPVDCASIPENLLESELFGHEKGAFTDAQSSKSGLLEYADGGTIFFDEIGEMPFSLQAKLLRVLQEKQFRRIGSNRLITVDIRILAATNRDLIKEVKEKRFREDLYYRLNVIHIQMPPLRERDGDIALLVHHFFHEFTESNNRGIKGIAPDTLKTLELYSWPGNVRELENVIERAISLADSDMIRLQDLPPHIRLEENRMETIDGLKSFKQAKSEALKDFYQKYFEKLVAKHKGNISQAAAEAQIDRKTIHRLLNRYRIDVKNNQ